MNSTNNFNLNSNQEGGENKMDFKFENDLKYFKLDDQNYFKATYEGFKINQR